MKRYAIIVIGLLFLVFGQSREIPAAPYYEGKVIRIIVGFSPGGGYDRMARLVGKYLPKYIPGKPSVIIENMVGADSIIAANYVYNIAKPDGLTICAFNAAIPLNQLSKLAGIKYDVRKYAWIGSTAVTSAVLVVRANLPYKTIQELIASKHLLMVGAMGQASNSAQIPRMLQEYCGLNIKLIMYPASAESMLALERNEVDSRAGSYDSFKPYIDRGAVRPLVRGYVATKETESLPVNEDLTADKKGKAVMRMLSITDLMGRPYVCPPGTPAGTMNILKDAFARMSADPDARADARKTGMELQYVPAKEIEKTINFAFSQPQEVMAEFMKLVQ